MNRETSVYLDLIRFTAAMVVMIGHLSGERFTQGLAWQFGLFMDDAVMVFFVLSGFVIGYVVDHKEKGLEPYVIARAARIYSVAVPALLLTFVLDDIGRGIAPALYSPDWGYNGDNLVVQFLAGLFFVNQLWYMPVGTGSMLPYWSLGFEVWYYVFFGVLFFARAPWKLPLVLATFALAGPRIVAFFPIWMLGYWTYCYSKRAPASRHAGWGLLALSTLCYALYHIVFKDWFTENPVLSASLGLDNFLPRYVVGLLFAMHLLGFVWLSQGSFTLFKRLETPIRWLAGATFTIYLFHLPVAQFLTTIVPWPPSDARTRLVLFGGTTVLMFVIAHFTERRKAVWSEWFKKAHQKTVARFKRPTPL